MSSMATDTVRKPPGWSSSSATDSSSVSKSIWSSGNPTSDDEDDYGGPRFWAPSLGVDEVTAGEILLAAEARLGLERLKRRRLALLRSNRCQVALARRGHRPPDAGDRHRRSKGRLRTRLHALRPRLLPRGARPSPPLHGALSHQQLGLGAGPESRWRPWATATQPPTPTTGSRPVAWCRWPSDGTWGMVPATAALMIVGVLTLRRKEAGGGRSGQDDDRGGRQAGAAR